MNFFIYIALIISLTMFCYEVISLLMNIPDVSAEKKINRLKRRTKIVKNDKDNILLIRFIIPLFRFFKTKMKIFTYNEFKIKSDLEKIGVKDAPEVYMAKGLLYAFTAGIGCFIFSIITGSVIFVVLGIFFAVGFPFYPKSNLRGKVAKINDEILKEFPNFVSAMRYQYGKGKTLNDIVQSYIDVAGPALKYELQKLSAELEMMSDNDALLRFGDRVGLAEVSNFSSSLVYGQMYGMNVDGIFAIQEQEMRRLTRDNIRKLMKRKPIVLTVTLMLPIMNILMVVAVPPIVSMIKDLGSL